MKNRIVKLNYTIDTTSKESIKKALEETQVAYIGIENLLDNVVIGIKDKSGNLYLAFADNELDPLLIRVDDLDLLDFTVFSHMEYICLGDALYCEIIDYIENLNGKI